MPNWAETRAGAALPQLAANEGPKGRGNHRNGYFEKVVGFDRHLEDLRGLAAPCRRARTTASRHSYPIAPNRLGRNFVAQAPNQIWLADLTYIPTGEGWLYLAATLDMHTRKIVGWSTRETLHSYIALEALNMAIKLSDPQPD